jgi:Flp pilus assembly protein TadB
LTKEFEGIGSLIVMALFAGSTAHLLGFEVSEPRDGSDVETIAVAVILVVSGAVFTVVRWPGLHEAAIAGIMVVVVTVLIWMVREVTS